MHRQMVRCAVVALFALLLAASAPARGASILITQFEYSGYAEMKANLEAAGHTVDIVDARTGGNVAAALGSGSYSQVFLWDLTASLYLNAADVSALGSFFSAHKNLVVDGRSYGYHFQPNQASEVALLRNIASAFDARGGGVWVGTDHDPDWTHNGNAFLSAIGVNPVTGIYSDPVNTQDPASILLTGVTATDLWGGGQSIGRAPLGIQPNGMDMRFHFGHDSAARGSIPYITASFGTFQAPNEPPRGEIPEPSTFALFGAGLIGLAAVRRRSK